MRTYPDGIKTGADRASYNLKQILEANYDRHKKSPSTESRQFARSTARAKAKFEAKRSFGIAKAKRSGALYAKKVS